MPTTLKHLPKSEVEIRGTLTPKEYEATRPHVLKELQKEIKLDGFRTGHIPEKVLIEKVGEEYILGESIEHAMKLLYPELIVEHNLFPIGRPQISLEGKVEAGKPIEYKIVTAILPTITLPDYKALAKATLKEEPKTVLDSDVDAVLKDLQRLKARSSKTPEKEGEDVPKESAPSDLPPIDDEFAQSFGQFKDLAEFKERMRQNLESERQKESKDKYRLTLLDSVIKETKADLPEILIESELNLMRAELENSLSRAGLELIDYLREIKKTDEELRAEWRDNATKRALSNLSLREIGKVEKLAPTDDEITTEVLRILGDYEGADPERTRQYVEEVLFNDKVFKFLEEQGVSEAL